MANLIYQGKVLCYVIPELLTREVTIPLKKNTIIDVKTSDRISNPWIYRNLGLVVLFTDKKFNRLLFTFFLF